MNPLISIIIPTKNESRNIERCLKSIVKNGYRKYEIILVDQQSSDKTVEIAKKYKAIVIKAPKTDKYLPPSNSRNIGFKKSHGDYIYNVDADMELQPGLLQEIIKKFSSKNISALVIPEIDRPTNFWAKGKAFERSLYFDTPMEAARVSRRVVFEKTKYDMTITSGEDWNIHSEFSKFGRIGRTSKVVYHHIGNISLLKEISKKTNYGQGSGTYISRNTQNLIELSLLLVPIYIKGIIVNIFANPLGILAFIVLRFADAVALVWGLIKG